MVRSSYSSVVLLVSTLTVCGGPLARAQTPPGAFAGQASIISRDAQGRPTIRAISVPDGLELDGRLDEPIYEEVAPVSDFVQMEPTPGAPATEKTDVWIAYDADNVYVTVRCWDSQPEQRWIANEMRRDHINIVRNENVAFLFDTFFDRRNGVYFEVNAIGGFMDGTALNERSIGNDWNPVWERATGRFEGGWTVEAAIPFKSLRYNRGANQTWGFNLRRTVRWKNEESYVVEMPLVAGTSGSAALFQVSKAATVVGIQAPSGSRNLDVKAYALSSVTTNRLERSAQSNDLDGDVGVDVKYGITQNLTADFTYNTDFAQVEVDTQQVNLTRFSLFFPEKRDFFLEGQGIFEFGGAQPSFAGRDVPLLFFSRRIGLNAGRPIPIDAGGRLTGRVGRYSIGAVNVQTGDDAESGTRPTNFSVIRVKRDILRRSSIGLLFTGRSKSTVAAGSGETYGVDTTLRLHELVTLNAYLAKTSTPGLTGDDMSHRVRLEYHGDRYGLELERIAVGDHFVPDVGFLQRDDYTRSFVAVRFSPRPKSTSAVRQFTYRGFYDFYEDGNGRMETRDVSAEFGAEFHSGDELSIQASRRYEFLEQPFRIAPSVAIAPGGYPFTEGEAAYALGAKRRVSGRFAVGGGTFYSGNRKTIGVTTGRVLLSPQLSFEPGASINWVSLREEDFTSTVLANRVTYTFTPLMFLSGLVQYNSTARTVGSNVRLRWEYQPGSELFLVYTDERDTLARGYPELRNRAFVVKINRLLRF